MMRAGCWAYPAPLCSPGAPASKALQTHAALLGELETTGLAGPAALAKLTGISPREATPAGAASQRVGQAGACWVPGRWLAVPHTDSKRAEAEAQGRSLLPEFAFPFVFQIL